MASVRVPPTVFGIPFGLAGVAGGWVVAAGEGNAPTWVGDALLVLAAVVWLATTGGLRGPHPVGPPRARC